MIKHSIQFLIIITCMITTGCSAQKNILTENINAAANKQPIEDTVLQKLQKENDLVLAFAIEKFAWVKSIDYHILAHINNEWKGYIYHKNLMPNNTASPTTIRETNVDKAAADALVKFLSDNKAWTIKGDGENGFCADGNKNCNINDAAGSRLWLITKTAAINPSYYAPDFYEKCCPEQQRGLFLTITQKIEAIAPDNGITE